jgi:uncharacterized ferritin-like protein (DUF455 family)
MTSKPAALSLGPASESAPIEASAPEARLAALNALLCTDPQGKCAAVDSITCGLFIDRHQRFVEPAPLPHAPGRPLRPALVDPTQLQARNVQTRVGRAGLLHALAHIEFNAINLALDIVWRFPDMPEQFYEDWLKVAREETLHFRLLCARLAGLDHQYGDFPAHDGLWEMAQKTASDLLARLALVPRTLEARGLDASPAVRRKLASVGDTDSAQVIDLILRDEIGHVAIGNHWFAFVCGQHSLNRYETYDALALRYGAPKLKGPFNLPARQAAGFDDIELARLQAR